MIEEPTVLVIEDIIKKLLVIDMQRDDMHKDLNIQKQYIQAIIKDMQKIEENLTKIIIEVMINIMEKTNSIETNFCILKENPKMGSLFYLVSLFVKL